MRKVRVAINGFGRIGRNAFKVALKHSDALDIVALNDLADAKTLSHLLAYDSVHGRYEGEISAAEGALIVDGVTYPVLGEKDPTQLPWSELNVDVVIESTGIFTTAEKMQMHLDAGAKAVMLSAPGKGEGIETFVRGVNTSEMKKEHVFLSNASCTTNCIAPVMAVLERDFGIEKAMMTTVHGYTSTQALIDGPDMKDPRRGRAAAINIIPSTTGAALATGKVIPSLANTFDGMAVRVPVPNGSLSDITALLKRDVTVDAVNEALIDASREPGFQSILAVSNDPIVSSDIIGRTESSIVDLPFTKVVGGNLVKVLSWYDNEIGYSYRLIEQTIQAGAFIVNE